MLLEATSVYSAKLNQFLEGQPKEVQQFIKKALNQIFMGIKADFDGYIEGKRPTIKNYGDYQVFKMMIQANSDVKKDSDDEKGKWNFHDPVQDYCKGLGKIIRKKIDSDTYDCVVYDHKEDLENVYAASDYEDLTSQAVYPMVGCCSTGIGGSYKNLTKAVPGTTYSVIVSVPDILGESYSNPFMTKHGNRYSFSNDYKDSSGYGFICTYDIGDDEFVTRKSKPGDPETFTCVYTKGRNGLKAFKTLVNSFDKNTTPGDVEEIFAKNGIRIRHSWFFNPYTD